MEYSSIDEVRKQFRLMKSVYAGIRIVDPTSKEVVSTIKAIQKADEQVIESSSEHICYQFWGNGQICTNCISKRAIQENRTLLKISNTEKESVYAVTASPIIVEDRTLVIELIQDVSNNCLCFDFVHPCNELEQMRFYVSDHIDQMLIKDKLTDIYNRRFIDEMLPRELTCAYDKGIPVSLIYADIDLFKVINDTYGHVVGDGVLQEVAKILQQSIRSDGWVARYGGEEFLICLPGVNEECGRKIAERMRHKVMEREIIVRNHVLHVTCSFGVQEAFKDKYPSIALDVITCADHKMYNAKQLGRNRVV